MKILHELLLPQDSVNDDEVKIVRLALGNGDFVKKGSTVLEYETSKTVTSIVSDIDGYVGYLCDEGEMVQIGAVVACLFDDWDPTKAQHLLARKSPAAVGAKRGLPASISMESGTLYSDRAEKLIIEHRLERSKFSGRDFVSVYDVEKVIAESLTAGRHLPNQRVKQDGELGVVQKERSTVPLGSKKVGGRTRKLKDRERIVIVCANHITSDVIQDLLANQDDKMIVGYVVDDQYKATSPGPVLDTNVLDFPERVSRSSYDSVILAMGGSLRSMRFRKLVFDHYRRYEISFANLISPTANIASNVSIGIGNIIESNVYVGTGSVIGDNNFISYATVIGHHNRVGSCNLFAPGVMMAGLVSIGDDCVLPTGVNFIDRVRIGSRVVLPVGFNVTSNLNDDAVVKFRS